MNLDPELAPAAEGDSLSAAEWNRLAAKASRALSGEGIEGGLGGSSHFHLRTDALELYQLYSAPALDTDSKEYKATGKPVYLRWVTVDGSGHYSAESYKGAAGAVERYRLKSSATAETIVWPATPHDATYQEATSVPSEVTGDRVWVIRRRDFLEAVSGGGGDSQLFVATGDVTQGTPPYISAKKCTKRDGSAPTGSDITVYFLATHGGQPAVFTGDVFTATQDSAGDWYATSDHSDDYINSIKMWSGAVATLPVHWQFCDGTNSSPDLRGRFIVCADFDTVSPAHTANHTDEDVGDKSDDSGVGGYDNIEVDWRRISGVEPENPGSGCTVLYGSGPAADAPGAGYRVGDLISVNGTVCICKVEAIDGSGGVTAVSFVSGSATWTGSLATTGANGVPVVSDVKNNPAMTGDTPDDKWSGTLPSASTTIKAVDNRPRYYALAYIMRWK